MSDTEQEGATSPVSAGRATKSADSPVDGIPVPAFLPTPSDAPALESVPDAIIIAPPANIDSRSPNSESVVERGAEVPAASPAPASGPTSPAPAPAESPAPEHSNIPSTGADTNSIGLENVGMSVEATPSLSVPPSSVAVESSSPLLPPPAQSSPAPAAPVYGALLSLRDKALNAIQFRRRARLEKIIALAEKKGSIGNDDVEKLLRVSNATASRYLSTLVQDGRLKRLGLPHASRYSPSTGSNGAV